MRVLQLAVACLLAGLAFAEPRPALSSPLSSIGRGVAIIFSPDLSVGNNCAFYERLGFTWKRCRSSSRTCSSSS
jgi:hypothetical protein